MSEVTINRRQAVRAAAGVAAGGLLVAGAGVGSASAASSDLLGTWLITHEDDDGESGLSLASFIADGVIVVNDIRPAGSVGTGSWEDKGDDKFKATAWYGFPGRGHLREGRGLGQAQGRQDLREVHRHRL